MKSIVFLLVLASCSVTNKTLDVSFKKQSTGYWCWAAVTSMAVNYLNQKDLTDCKVASQFLSKDCCGNPKSCYYGRNPQELIEGVSKNYNVDARLINEPLSYNDFKREINKGKIIFAVLNEKEGQHLVILAGFLDPAFVIVFDPARGVITLPYGFVKKSNWLGTWIGTFILQRHVLRTKI